MQDHMWESIIRSTVLSLLCFFSLCIYFFNPFCKYAVVWLQHFSALLSIAVPFVAKKSFTQSHFFLLFWECHFCPTTTSPTSLWIFFITAQGRVVPFTQYWNFPDKIQLTSWVIPLHMINIYPSISLAFSQLVLLASNRQHEFSSYLL